MNWSWLRRHRRMRSAGGLSRGGTRRLAQRKAVGQILCAGLGVVVAGGVAGCSTGPGPATTAVRPSLLISRTAPDAPVGRQLTWFLGAMADIPKGQTFVVVAMLSDPAATLSPSAETGLLAIVRGAFGLLR
jgi:hypothetical protein